MENNNEIKTITIKEVARRLGKSEQFVRIGLQKGILPFGTAVQLSSRYTYHISIKLLNEYLGESSSTIDSKYSKIKEI